MFRVFKINDFNGSVHRFVYNCDRREIRRIRRSISAQIKKNARGSHCNSRLGGDFRGKAKRRAKFPLCVYVYIYKSIIIPDKSIFIRVLLVISQVKLTFRLGEIIYERRKWVKDEIFFSSHVPFVPPTAEHALPPPSPSIIGTFPWHDAGVVQRIKREHN